MTDSKLYEIIAGEEDVGGRLDAVLARHIKDCSRKKIQEFIGDSKVCVDDAICSTSSAKIGLGQKITAHIILRKSPELLPSKDKIDILFEDDDLLVVNKPAGLVVHPSEHGRAQQTLMASIMDMGINLSDILGDWRRGIVHRLDKETSGVMLMAKNNKAHESLADQIKARSAQRNYLALVWSIPAPPAAVIDLPLAKGKLHYRKMVISDEGKPAITHYALQEILFSGRMSLVECKLETGRTHQIRVHMSHIGCPVVGDKLYGANEKYLKFLASNAGDKIIYLKDKPYHCLHSRTIEFDHPTTAERLKFDADLPYFFKNILEAKG